jgi:transposase-like protein
MARKYHTGSFKAQVALEALRNDSTLAELSKKYDVNPNLITKWKTDLVKQASELFQRKKDRQKKDHTDYLERKIGQLTVENDFLKKNWSKYRSKSE